MHSKNAVPAIFVFFVFLLLHCVANAANLVSLDWLYRAHITVPLLFMVGGQVSFSCEFITQRGYGLRCTADVRLVSKFEGS